MPPKASSSSGKAGDGLSLPLFLKLLSSPKSKLTMSQAMKAAQKLFPLHASLGALSVLNQDNLNALGLEEEIVKGILNLTSKGKAPKRARGSDMDKPLPTKEVEEIVATDLDFEEILYEEALMLKSVVVNRAPVMSAWGFIVSERLGFSREEALSIAQVFTSLNSTTKGISLGIIAASEAEPEPGSSAQPFVEIMGRKVPVLQTQTGSYRAILKGAVVKPSEAFFYIKRAFKQQTGCTIGALRLLAESYDPEELNSKGYGMYLDFRPESDGWGKKAEMKMKTILDCRKPVESDQEDEEKVKTEEDVKGEEDLVKEEEEGHDAIKEEERDEVEEGRMKKKPKVEIEIELKDDFLDEFDRELDDDLDWALT